MDHGDLSGIDSGAHRSVGREAFDPFAAFGSGAAAGALLM